MQHYIASPQEPSAGQGYTASNFETQPPISDLNKKYNLIEHQELSLSLGDASIYKALEESPQASSLSEQPALDYFPAREMLGRMECWSGCWDPGCRLHQGGGARLP